VSKYVTKRLRLEDGRLDESTLRKVLELSEELKRNSRAAPSDRPEKKAFNELLAHDVDRIYESLQYRFKQYQSYDFEKEKELILKVTEHVLTKTLGLDLDHAFPISLVGALPGPLRKLPYAAYTVTTRESRYLRLPVGIYFKMSSIVPFSTRRLLAHEECHSATQDRHSVIWFDEGLAEYVATIAVAEMERSPQAARVVTGIAVENPAVWPIYLKFMRMVGHLAVLDNLLLLRKLCRLKLKNHKRVKWHEIPRLLQEGKSATEVADTVIEGRSTLPTMRPYSMAQTVARAFVSMIIPIRLSPLGYITFKEIVKENGLSEANLVRKLGSERWNRVLRELTANLLVVKQGRKIFTDWASMLDGFVSAKWVDEHL